MRITHFAPMIAAGSLLFTACGESTRSGPAAKPVPVGVITARNESVPVVLEAPGTVQARDRAVLSAQINGFVREVRTRAGDIVAAGQILVTLDARDADSQKAMAQAGIEEARAALAEARRGAQLAESMRAATKASSDLASGTYLRYQRLFEARSVSPQELDEVRSRRDSTAADLAAREAMVAAAQDRLREVEAKIAQADAQSRRADVYLSWTVVRAPSAGRVVERNVDPGSAIFPGSPLITLESTSKPQVLASIPTTASGLLRNGLKVGVRIPDQPEASVKGRVSEISPISAPGSHTVQFKVGLPPSFPAISGRFVEVEIPAGTRQALLVPVQALRENGQLTGVFIAEGSTTARFRLVKTTSFDAERAELLAGIEPGEKIIAKLTDQIVDGTPLEIRP